MVYVLTKLRKIVLSLDGVRQYEIAAATHIHPYTFSLYCQGRKEISPKHLRALSEVLNLPPGDIVGTVEYPIDTPSDSPTVNRKTV